MRGWLPAVLMLLAVSPARGDILVWRDADGVRHFTNRADAVPSDLTPDVLVRGSNDVVSAPIVAAPAPAAPPAATAASDIARLDEAYRAGLSAGLSVLAAADGAGGGGGGAAAGGAVEIVGPLAVANAHATDEDAAWSPYGAWPLGYYPFVTTGFDGGRSRHQTLRMLLQDQFAIDRGGPYAYARWDRPGVGPALAPFLPRGLPLPVQQYGRVLYR